MGISVVQPQEMSSTNHSTTFGSRFFSWASREDPRLADPWVFSFEAPWVENPVQFSCTSDLENCEVINGCWFTLLTLWSFILQQHKTEVQLLTSPMRLPFTPEAHSRVGEAVPICFTFVPLWSHWDFWQWGHFLSWRHPCYTILAKDIVTSIIKHCERSHLNYFYL